MEYRRIRRAVGGQRIQRGIQQALARRIALLLVENGHHAGKDGRGEAGAAGNGQILG